MIDKCPLDGSAQVVTYAASSEGLYCTSTESDDT